MDAQILNRRAILGAVFRRLRIREGLNQTAMANALGVSNPTYSRIESGAQEATVTQLALIARQVGVSSSRILLEVDRTHELDKRP